jgi:hypothetical protein
MSQAKPGYRAILIQERTFDRLKRFWREGDDRDENALARLATAFVELGLQTESHLPAARLAAKQMLVLERIRALPGGDQPKSDLMDSPFLTP